jgi:hypothetical protein
MPEKLTGEDLRGERILEERQRGADDADVVGMGVGRQARYTMPESP